MRNERQCLNKKPHLSRIDARIIADRMLDRKGVVLRTYKCPNCTFWHNTSKPLRAKLTLRPITKIRKDYEDVREGRSSAPPGK